MMRVASYWIRDTSFFNYIIIKSFVAKCNAFEYLKVSRKAALLSKQLCVYCVGLKTINFFQLNISNTVSGATECAVLYFYAPQYWF